MGLLDHGQRHAHVSSKGLATFVELHHAAARVVLAVPDDLVRGSLVEAEAERWLVLPHLTSDIITAAKFVAEALAVGVQHEAANTAERLRGQELHLGIWIVWLHEASWVHLHPLQIHRLSADALTDLDAIASAVLTVGSWQMQKIWAVLGQQRVVAKIGSKAARRKDNGAILLVDGARLAVLAANHSRA